MENKYSPEVILRSRVRLARNIVDYPFPPVLDDTCRREIIEKAASVLTKNDFAACTDLEDPAQAHVLAEEHLISREFANSKEIRALFLNAARDISVMVCEEDHLRIQAFQSGLSLADAKKMALDTERSLDAHIRFAYDSDLGYRTHCPTNLGTAMRASVMMFLPALTLAKRMGDLKGQLEKIGITVRGLYGEGSSADACIYQISNSLSLGLSEDDLVHKVETVAIRISEDEMEARKSIFASNKDSLTDKIFRSLGILEYAHMLSGKEFLDCYAYIRLGISLGIIQKVHYTILDTLLQAAMPAHILLQDKNAANDTALRDRLRAQTVRKAIGGRN